MPINIPITPKMKADLIRLGYLDARRSNDLLAIIRATQKFFRDFLDKKAQQDE
jgi:hypothetical protein